MGIKAKVKVGYLNPHITAREVDGDIDKLAITYLVYGMLIVLVGVAIKEYGLTNILNLIINLLNNIKTMF